MSRSAAFGLIVALLLASAACGGGRIFGKTYEYEEDLYVATDGTAICTAADGREVEVWLALTPYALPRVQDYSITVTS